MHFREIRSPSKCTESSVKPALQLSCILLSLTAAVCCKLTISSGALHAITARRPPFRFPPSRRDTSAPKWRQSRAACGRLVLVEARDKHARRWERWWMLEEAVTVGRRGS